ncbi:MAG: transglutaminase family protein [Myxococcales bacterium]|nr:transglutaminase family protein [Myxococcales bacterium]
MSTVTSELWSDSDARYERDLSTALRQDDLRTALFAVEGADPVAQDRAANQLAAWVTECKLQLAQGTAPVAALRQVLSVGAGLAGVGYRGERCDYYAAENSALSSVVKRRSGQPIVVSGIWMLVGRGAGLQVDGVGLPGHFVVRVGGSQGALADPFAGGEALCEAGCAAIVDRLSGGALPWEDAYLRPATTQSLVTRVLRNLANAHRRADNPLGLYRAVRLLASISPDDSEAALMHARLAEHLGACALARSLYESVSLRFPDSCAASVATRRIAVVLRIQAEQH